MEWLVKANGWTPAAVRKGTLFVKENQVGETYIFRIMKIKYFLETILEDINRC